MKIDKTWKNEIGKVPGSPFKKVCPCTILPPLLFNFSDSFPPPPSLRETSLKFTHPFKKKEAGPKNVGVCVLFSSLFIEEGRVWKSFEDSPWMSGRVICTFQGQYYTIN